jgi:predicted phage terminase large subunit-like protein
MTESIHKSSTSTSTRSDLRQSICRKHSSAFLSFSPSSFAQHVSRGKWRLARHLIAIDAAVIDTIYGVTAPLLIIEAPPRHGKSELISKYLPAWYLGHFPERRVMLAGYSASFARSWGRKARDLLAESGTACFGYTVDRQVHGAADWGVAGTSGGMVTAGTGGPLTGRGAHLLIIDDPIKNAEQALSATVNDNHWDWWQSTASTRLEPGGCAIVIATRWSRDDLSGRLIRASEQGTGTPVRRLHLPALAEENDPLGRAPGEPLWPERWSREQLEQLRRAKDDFWWEAMYQQNPQEPRNRLWPADYFPDELWVDEFPQRFEASIVALDPATGLATGDYTAVVFAGYAQGFYWIDASVRRDPAEVGVTRALEMAARHGAQAVAIEEVLFERLLSSEFLRQRQARGQFDVGYLSILQHTPKFLRINRLGPMLSQHALKIRRTPDNELLVQQLRDFPTGRHDDGPDALEMAVQAIGQIRKHNRAASVAPWEEKWF